MVQSYPQGSTGPAVEMIGGRIFGSGLRANLKETEGPAAELRAVDDPDEGAEPPLLFPTGV